MSAIDDAAADVQIAGLRLLDDEVLAITAVRRRPWPSVFITRTEQSGGTVSETEARRMVERGALSLVARGLAELISGRIELGPTLTALLDGTESRPHTVVYSGADRTPLNAGTSFMYFCRHTHGTLIDTVHGNGLRTLQVVADDTCPARIVAAASATFHQSPSDGDVALHIAHPDHSTALVTTVAPGTIVTGEISYDHQWTAHSESPFWDESAPVAGWAQRPQSMTTA